MVIVQFKRLTRREVARKAAETNKKKNHTTAICQSGIVAPVKPEQTPMVTAINLLGARLVEKPSGYFLDGVPANLNQIMMETNRILVENGQPQFKGNPAWVVHASS